VSYQRDMQGTNLLISDEPNGYNHSMLIQDPPFTRRGVPAGH
jgi:hypothetical protein